MLIFYKGETWFHALEGEHTVSVYAMLKVLKKDNDT
jgi:hypothetical protein